MSYTILETEADYKRWAVEVAEIAPEFNEQLEEEWLMRWLFAEDEITAEGLLKQGLNNAAIEEYMPKSFPVIAIPVIVDLNYQESGAMYIYPEDAKKLLDAAEKRNAHANGGKKY